MLQAVAPVTRAISFMMSQGRKTPLPVAVGRGPQEIPSTGLTSHIQEAEVAETAKMQDRLANRMVLRHHRL